VIVNQLRAVDWTTQALPLSRQRDSDEQVIRVDWNDRALGPGGKLEVHQGGLLHRAFSIVVFDWRNRLLLQRRADGKYHFAGLWSNTCCGHPRPGETTYHAAARRLEEEFGFVTPLDEFSEFVYRAWDPVSSLAEYEYLHVFRGVFSARPQPNPDEVGSWRWMSLPRVRHEIQRSPSAFTPWFALLLRRIFSTDAARRA